MISGQPNPQHKTRIAVFETVRVSYAELFTLPQTPAAASESLFANCTSESLAMFRFFSLTIGSFQWGLPLI